MPEVCTVLIVDDNQDDRENYLRSLKKIRDCAYSCLEAEDGKKGIEMAKSRPIDCVLLDYSLPGMNGLEVLRNMHLANEFLPVVLLTGQGNETIAVEAIKQGANDYITKSSVNPERLHHIINSAINQNTMKREIVEKEAQIRENNKSLEKYINALEAAKGQQESLISKLKESESTFRSVVEYSTIGIALISPHGRWLRVNKALCDLLGYEQEELFNKNFESLFHEGDRENDLEYINKILTGEISSYKVEKRCIHKNGRAIWTLLCTSLVHYATGEPNYFIFQILDITERKEMEHVKNEFISVVSHELRTPLTSIRGSLGLILGAMSSELTEKIIKLLDTAHRNSERLMLLINDILDMDKIEAGEMRFEINEELVSMLVEQSIEANKAYSDKFKVLIKTKTISPDKKILVDKNRFVQVLSNLISNAVKFSHEGSVVEIFTTYENGYTRVNVQDNGIGIPTEFQHKIFKKFSQVDSSVTRIKGGTGLGLHITKSMVERMGGKIGFESEYNKGTTFWIEFPDINTKKSNGILGNYGSLNKKESMA